MNGTAPPAGAALYRPPRARRAGPQIPSPPSPASGTKTHAGSKQQAGRLLALSQLRLVQMKRAAATAYPRLCAFVVVKKVVAGIILGFG